MIEKRAHQRIACQTSVLVRNPELLETASLSDLSCGGARLKWTQGNLAAGHRVVLTLQNAPFSFKIVPGCVVQSSEGCVRVRFDAELDSTAVRQIEKFAA